MLPPLTQCPRLTTLLHMATHHSRGQGMFWELQTGPVRMKLPEAMQVKFVCLLVSWIYAGKQLTLWCTCR